MACQMGQYSTIEYINKFREYLVNCADVLKSKAKYIFEMSLDYWLSALLLPYNCIGLYTTISIC